LIKLTQEKNQAISQPNWLQKRIEDVSLAALLLFTAPLPPPQHPLHAAATECGFPKRRLIELLHLKPTALADKALIRREGPPSLAESTRSPAGKHLSDPPQDRFLNIPTTSGVLRPVARHRLHSPRLAVLSYVVFCAWREHKASGPTHTRCAFTQVVPQKYSLSGLRALCRRRRSLQPTPSPQQSL
jgi:hypothetical protein